MDLLYTNKRRPIVLWEGAGPSVLEEGWGIAQSSSNSTLGSSAVPLQRRRDSRLVISHSLGLASQISLRHFQSLLRLQGTNIGAMNDTGGMLPMHVLVEQVRPQHCLSCAHDGQPLLDTFAIVSGQTMLSELVDTVLSALGMPQLIQDSRG
ncbi:ubiquitin-like oligomerization domain of SATB domain-containing protein [Ditylenchus destructor]|nr:ubiquitin-like oligomerization domain of SATB domain-containing protein [Ditylenchus destructor]